MKIILFKKTIYLFWVSKSEIEKTITEKLTKDLNDYLRHSTTQI